MKEEKKDLSHPQAGETVRHEKITLFLFFLTFY